MTKVLYVDAAASAQKSESVINAEMDFLRNGYANAGRGICARANAVDKMVADTRIAVARFIGADSPDQIIFTSGTTDGLNRIPRILDLSGSICPESIVCVSDLDHHSARLPWEEYAYLGKCKLTVCPLDTNFDLDLGAVPRADIFVITAMSNVLGVPQDVKKLVAAARAKNPNVIVVVDAAQYVAHEKINVLDWDPDFLCFSGHKIGADTGIGVMYIKDPARWAVDKLGGGMVSIVGARGNAPDVGANNIRPNHQSQALSEWTLANVPARWEAGTLPLTQIAGLRSAIQDQEQGSGKERELLDYLYSELSKIPRIKILSVPDSVILTFVVDGMHPLDFGAMMGARGVCLRVGNMCASWLHARLGLAGTIRISPGAWNTMDEMKELVGIVKEVVSRKP